MEEDIHLSAEAIKIIKSFEQAIDKAKIWNDDKIYLSHLPKALLNENYIWAVSIGFVFLEKYLRFKLIFEIHKKSKNPWEEFLHALDRIEKELEDWESWCNIYNDRRKSLNELIQKYWVDNSVTRANIIQNLNDYLSFIDEVWPSLKSQYSFNQICSDLRKYWVITGQKQKHLIKIFTKYRNTVQHWLFKRLFDSMSWNHQIPVARYNWENIDVINADISNMLFREINLVPNFKEISIFIFNEIHQLMAELWDIEAN